MAGKSSRIRLENSKDLLLFQGGKCRWFGCDSTEMVVFGLPTELAMAGLCRADMVGGKMVVGLGPHCG
jgi:hypothetical protein